MSRKPGLFEVTIIARCDERVSSREQAEFVARQAVIGVGLGTRNAEVVSAIIRRDDRIITQMEYKLGTVQLQEGLAKAAAGEAV